jgi:hypothetical protein
MKRTQLLLDLASGLALAGEPANDGPVRLGHGQTSGGLTVLPSADGKHSVPCYLGIWPKER